MVVLGQTRYAKAVLRLGVQRLRMIRFRFAAKPAVSLSLPDDNYDLMEDLSAYQQPWDTIPEQDLILQAEERTDLANRAAVMEVALNHPLLRDGAILVVSPCKELCNVAEVFSQCTRGAQPILVYAIELDHLTSSDLSELQQHRQLAPNLPLFFIRVPQPAAYANYDSSAANSPARHPSLPAAAAAASGTGDLLQQPQAAPRLFADLCELGFLSMMPGGGSRGGHPRGLGRLLVPPHRPTPLASRWPPSWWRTSRRTSAESSSTCAAPCSKFLVQAATLLNDNHCAVLNNFILAGFLIWPEAALAKSKELELYNSLIGNFHFQPQAGGNPPADCLHTGEHARVPPACTPRPSSSAYATPAQSHGGQRTPALQRADPGLVMAKLKLSRISDPASAPRPALLPSRRLGRHVPRRRRSRVGHEQAARRQRDAKRLRLHRTMRPNQVEDQREDRLHLRFGALLDKIKGAHDLNALVIAAQAGQRVAPGGRPGDARQPVGPAARPPTCAARFPSGSGRPTRPSRRPWRRLEERLSAHTAACEDQRDLIRRRHARQDCAPGAGACLKLDGRSAAGSTEWFTPARPWGGFSPVAVKSVVPPDDKHWNDLALDGPAVLLIMERLTRDLHAAIKQNLNWPG
uniref:Guanylate kinase-like domain-containing protein n=1 Tax=Macrostomum lignano TaxID=282301 RepID=A0A1I8FJS6_9PLAT